MPVSRDDLVAAWVAWSPAERERVLAINDEKIVQFLDVHMRSLLHAENEARRLGIKSPEQPFTFDHTQLPLLSTMQFDGERSEGGGCKVYKRVRWPKELSDDAAIVPACLRCALPTASSIRSVSPQHWLQLLPPPDTWLDLERALAQLVEQLVLREQQGAASGDEDGNDVPVTGRAAKRARQRERRRVGKAVARAALVGPAVLA